MDPIQNTTSCQLSADPGIFSNALYYEALTERPKVAESPEDEATSPPAGQSNEEEKCHFTFMKGLDFEALGKALEGLSGSNSSITSTPDDENPPTPSKVQSDSELPARTQISPVPEKKRSNSNGKVNYGFLPPNASSSDVAEFLKESSHRKSPVSKLRHVVQPNAGGKHGLVLRMKKTAQKNKREAPMDKKKLNVKTGES